MSSTFFLLDGAQGLIMIPILFIIHVILTVFIEGGILSYIKFKPFKRCLLDAFIINLCSLVIGLFLMVPFQSMAESIDPETESLYSLVLLGLFLIETVLVEGLLLYLLNKSFPVNKMILATIVMNIITYILIYFILNSDIVQNFG